MVTVGDPVPGHWMPENATGIAVAASMPAAAVLQRFETSGDAGLSPDEVTRRRGRYGPNAVSSHRARFLPVLWHQLKSPLLGLLMSAAVASYFVGERSDARVDVAELVPGDVVELRLGDIVPADIRLLEVTSLACDEAVLTGESLPVDKTAQPVPAGTPLAELTGCALMGTVVHAGSGRGVVVATGRATEFGKIAAGLSTHQLDTEFQVGLRKFSLLLVPPQCGPGTCNRLRGVCRIRWTRPDNPTGLSIQSSRSSLVRISGGGLGDGDQGQRSGLAGRTQPGGSTDRHRCQGERPTVTKPCPEVAVDQDHDRAQTDQLTD